MCVTRGTLTVNTMKLMRFKLLGSLLDQVTVGAGSCRVFPNVKVKPVATRKLFCESISDKLPKEMSEDGDLNLHASST